MSKKLIHFGNKGFTMVELIVTLAIMSIMIIVIADVYLNGLIHSKTDMKKAQLQIEAKSSMDGIMRNVKLSSSVEPVYQGFATDADTVILKMPAIKADETFIYNPPGSQTREFDYVIYYLENSNLHKVTKSSNSDSRLYPDRNTDAVILSNIKTLTFSYDTAAPSTKLVTVDYTIHNTSEKTPIEVALKTEGRLRNVQN